MAIGGARVDVNDHDARKDKQQGRQQLRSEQRTHSG
jgi:hypothetical protein